MRRAVAIAVAVLVVGIAWWSWPRRSAVPPSSPEPRSETEARPRSLATPAAAPEVPVAPAGPPSSDGLFETEIRVTTFGDPAREVRIQQVNGRAVGPPQGGTVRVRAKPGGRVRLSLLGAAVGGVRVDVPDPVPPRIEVRVPALDDPRLADPVLLVVDEKSGQPLPKALLDPGPRAPDVAPIPADAGGVIRVPRALAERIRADSAILTQGAVVTERDHVPAGWSSVAGSGETAADWAEWNETGVIRVRLRPLPADAEVPRRRLRVVDEDGIARAGSLVLMRYPSMEALGEPAMPARTDASGVVEVVAPEVAAYDVYDGAVLVGTFVLARAGATLESEPREIRVPKVVHVRVVLRGLEEPRPVAWLRGPDVVSLEPDDRTGWAHIDGQVHPGWKAFARSEGALVPVSGGPPAEIDLRLPRGRPVSLVVAGREAILRVEESKTVELDWTTLPPMAADPPLSGWSLTREGLDEMSGLPGPEASEAKDGEKK